MRSLLRGRPRRTVPGTLIASAAAISVLAGCTSSDESDADTADELAAAQAAAEEYVAAVAAADLEAVEALSADEALVVVSGLDVTEALPEVQTPISAEWVELLGREDRGVDPPQYTFQVSYVVGENVGADRITLELLGDDPADPAAWTVNEGLLSTARVPADREAVHRVAFGPVELGPLSIGSSASLELSGYPGAYQVEVTDADPGVQTEPGTVILGAQTTEAWNSTPPLHVIESE